MRPKVTVVDYGIGNTFSICNALDHCGADVALSGSIQHIRNAQRIVLPGVGAFKDGMANLEQSGIDDTIREFVASQRPVLGICLGMQMFLEKSEEFGIWDGLSLIMGKVVKIPEKRKDGGDHKVPHIGWNRIYPAEQSRHQWTKTLMQRLNPGSMVYFVHSFHAQPLEKEDVLAVCYYNGVAITAAVKKDNVYGCQFHPEKSGKNGMRIFNAFLSM